MIKFKTKSTHQFLDPKSSEIETHTGQYSLEATDATEAGQRALEIVRQAAGQMKVVNVVLSISIDHDH